jgi:hypothetical protein
MLANIQHFSQGERLLPSRMGVRASFMALMFAGIAGPDPMALFMALA